MKTLPNLIALKALKYNSIPLKVPEDKIDINSIFFKICSPSLYLLNYTLSDESLLIYSILSSNNLIIEEANSGLEFSKMF